MVLLLGATGYIGQAFARELQRREIPFYSLSRKELDYTRFENLWRHLLDEKPEFVINAAGFTGRPNVDACEIARADTLLGNTLFPQSLAQACLVTNVPYGHVSSGCIYNGAKIIEDGKVRILADLTSPEAKKIIAEQPSRLLGFNETDPPNFSFRSPPSSFYSGTKALAEEVMEGVGDGYLWRLRIPFDEENNPRNYLTKIQNYPKVYDNVNSISHRGDFTRACLDLFQNRAPFGTYNITNHGWTTTRTVVEKVQKILKPGRKFDFWADDNEFYKLGAKTPRSNCILDCSRLLHAGVQIPSIEEALERSLRSWKSC